MVTALCLYSGSLASRLAARLVAGSPQVERTALLHFRSPFFAEDERLREQVKDEWPGAIFRTQSLKKDYRRLANIPPGRPFSLKRSCLSCRTLMLVRAIRYMERIKADFIVTGDLVGRHGLGPEELERITEDLGVGGLVVRPLSARLLPPSLPEREGWLDESALYELRDGDDDALAQLASDLNLSAQDPMHVESRCKLTHPGFGRRLENLFQEDRFTLNALKLLEFSLYYKYPPDVKIVLAVDEEEKRALQTFFLPQDLRVYLPSPRSPLALVRTEWTEKSPREVDEIITLAARIAVTHSATAVGRSVPVKYRFEKDDETSQLNIMPFGTVAEIARVCFACNVSQPGAPTQSQVPLS